MESYTMLFNGITLGVGVFCLYTWFKLKKAGKLFESQFLIPKDSKITDCVDEEGYIRRISPFLLAIGLILALTGGVCILDSQFRILSDLFPQIENFGTILDQVCNYIGLAALIVYMIVWTKARKEFWI